MFKIFAFLGLIFGMILGSSLPGIELSTDDPLNSKYLHHTTAHFEDKKLLDADHINPNTLISSLLLDLNTKMDDYSSNIITYFTNTVNLIVNEHASAIGGFSPH
ncbi:MAG: hypothetical protein LBR15_11115 [Methanobrevibacter sp.]|jgi:hypothetical protein|nr:hypothetical protein [Candidatus Methanovirga australis]